LSGMAISPRPATGRTGPRTSIKPVSGLKSKAPPTTWTQRRSVFHILNRGSTPGLNPIAGVRIAHNSETFTCGYMICCPT
jgi:hypothetical protein